MAEPAVVLAPEALCPSPARCVGAYPEAAAQKSRTNPFTLKQQNAGKCSTLMRQKSIL